MHFTLLSSYCYLKNCQTELSFTTAIYLIALPTPSLLILPSATNFLNEPSIELKLNDVQSSLMSCFVNLPNLCKIAFRTRSTAGSFYYIRFKV